MLTFEVQQRGYCHQAYRDHALVHAGRGHDCHDINLVHLVWNVRYVVVVKVRVAKPFVHNFGYDGSLYHVVSYCYTHHILLPPPPKKKDSWTKKSRNLVLRERSCYEVTFWTKPSIHLILISQICFKHKTLLLDLGVRFSLWGLDAKSSKITRGLVETKFLWEPKSSLRWLTWKARWTLNWWYLEVKPIGRWTDIH